MSFINNIFRQNVFSVVKSEDNNIKIKENVDDLNVNQSKNVDKKI